MGLRTRIRPVQACLVLLLPAGGAVLFTQLALEVIATPGVAGHHDFLAFHAAAQLVSGGPAAGHLYDAASITAIERHVIAAPVGAAGYMPYLTPPFGAAIQAPLGLLSEPVARVIWLLVNIPLALLCGWLATADLPWRTRVLAAVSLVFVVTLPLVGWSTELEYAGFLVAVVGSHLDGAGAAGAAAWHGGISGMEAVNGLVAGYVGQQNVAVLDVLTVAGVAAVVARWVWIAWHVRPTVHDPRGRWVVVAGIAAAMLTDLHLYPQDCVLLLVALPLLTTSVTAEWRLPVVLGVAVFLDAAWLDQLPVTPHVFTWLLAGAFLWACAKAMRAGAPAGTIHSRATVSAHP